MAHLQFTTLYHITGQQHKTMLARRKKDSGLLEYGMSFLPHISLGIAPPVDTIEFVRYVRCLWLPILVVVYLYIWVHMRRLCLEIIAC